MRLTRFDPAMDSALVRACYEIYLAGAPSDDPHAPPVSPRVFAGWLRLGWTEDPQETWLARDQAGLPCGWYALSLPQRENRHLAEASLAVHPSRRRQGTGTALLRHLAERAHRQGRALLRAETREGSAWAAFARSVGARPGLTEVRRMLSVTGMPAGKLARLRASAEAAAAGYSVLRWDGPVPEERLAEAAAVYAGTVDVPRDPGDQAQQWDGGRVRLAQRRVAAQGLRYYVAAAQSGATGELAALTQLGVDPARPEWGFQEITVVARPHRGHRLGLLVKTAMLELLAEREPQLAWIVTGNADRNQHMIAINTELGFEVVDRWPSWQLEVAPLLADRRR